MNKRKQKGPKSTQYSNNPSTLEDLMRMAHALGMRLTVDLVPMEKVFPRCMYVDPDTSEQCKLSASVLHRFAGGDADDTMPVCSWHHALLWMNASTAGWA